MLAFVDESGDTGRRLDRDSSPYLALAMVVFPDSESAAQCIEQIRSLRRECGLPQTFEYHFSRNKPRRRREFLEAVSDSNFGCYHVFCLNKGSRRLYGPGFDTPSLMYNYTARLLFENASDYPQYPLWDAQVVFDRRGNRDLRIGMESYLMRVLRGGDADRAVSGIVSRAASRDDLLQLADYVAGVSYRALLGDWKSRGLFRDYLRSHQWTWRLWPPD